MTQAKPIQHEETQPDTRRLTAAEIFRAAVENARDELRRSNQKLAFSGIAGGLTMGLTGLGVAAMRSLTPGNEANLVAPYLLYPIGFIAVIIGRAQLFTENTLYPVVLVLDERKHVMRTLRLWGIVFGSNVVGAFLFAVLAVKSPALRADVLAQLIHLGKDLRPVRQDIFSGAESLGAG